MVSVFFTRGTSATAAKHGEQLAEQVDIRLAKPDLPAIFVGDFNATPHSLELQPLEGLCD